MTYHCNLQVPGDAVLPGEAEDVWQIEGEVEYATASCCQVGLIEENAHEEALRDGRNSEGEQEEEEDDRVAVVQHFPPLKSNGAANRN